MAIPTGATRVRLKTAPQRGQVLALAEIIPPHARQLEKVNTTRDDLVDAAKRLGRTPSRQARVAFVRTAALKNSGRVFETVAMRWRFGVGQGDLSAVAPCLTH